MEMQQIRYFLALSRTLHFTRAAEECCVTQPALTRAIQALEAELGGDLLRREGRQSHLTELGRRMLPLLQQCYDSAASAKSLAKAVASSEIAPLSLAVSNSVNIELLIGPLSELFRSYPGAQIRIRRGAPRDILDLLKSGDAEIAVAGPLAGAWDRLDCWPLFEERIELVVNASHRIGARNDSRVAISDLIGEPLLSRLEWESAAELSDLLASRGLHPEAAHLVETDADLFALLETNAGVGFITTSAPKPPNARRFSVQNLDLRRRVSVYCAAGRQRTPIATSFVNLMRAADWTEFGVSEPA